MQNIRNDLRTEVLARSLSATIGFSTIATLIFFSHHFPPNAQYVALSILAANVWRLCAYFFWKRDSLKNFNLAWHHFFWASILNPTLWGLCMLISTLDHYHTQWTIPLVLLITVGMVAASVFTLGYVRSLHSYFVIGMSLPTIAALSVAYWNTKDSFFINASIIVLVGGIYAVSQARIYRRRFIEKLKADLDLINSQKALLEQRAMTEHANRLTAIGELAAGFAHEINNPLAIITGNLQLIEVQFAKHAPPDAQIEKLLSRSIAASSRISKIIKGLRTLSRRSSNDGHTVHSLYSVVQETLGMFEERFYKIKIDFKLHAQDEFDIKCDSVQISQIVLNMLNNACDVLQDVPEHNERWIQIHIEKQGHMGIIEFTNGGPAIAQDVREKLFTPFFTTKPVGHGMGLGLSISRSIALQHNGDLSVTLKDGHTCFRLTLPVYSPAENSSAT